jgi:glycolate oxidase iron-sulfur subunit
MAGLPALQPRIPLSDPIARLQALAEQCVLCGLCLPHCPTYSLDRVESEGPRGRIRLAAGLASGRLAADRPDNWRGLDHCLGCRQCEAVCPANVQYGELLVEARRLQRSQQPPDVRQRLLEGLVLRPRLLALAMAGLRRLRPLLPRSLHRQLPSSAPTLLAPMTPATGARRGSVSLFLGCVARDTDRPVHEAAVRVLTGLGWDVHVPRSQGCCGALHRHAGAADGERTLEARNAAAFTDPQLSAVLVSASGCFDSVQRSLAGHVAVHELLAFVAADPACADLPLRTRPGTVALHVPCTQAAVVGAAAAAARVLGMIPGLQLLPLTAGHGCCGAAGTHMVLQPERAAALRAPLLEAAEASGAAVLCSGNIGCRLHIHEGLAARGVTMAVRHPIELLAEAMQ